MHERRPDKPDAIFTFTPSQEQLDALLAEVKKADTVEGAVRKAVSYLRESLDAQLEKARTLLINSLYPLLCASVVQTELSLEKENEKITSLPAISRVLQSALKVRTEEMQEWFQPGEAIDNFSVSLDDIGATVAERYKDEIDRSHLRICGVSKLPNLTVQGHHIRLVYDLWCEAVANAMAHSGLNRSYIRISAYQKDRVRGLTFSSLRTPGTPASRKIAGHPYQSMSAKLFREGESGLEKIASLAASVAEQQIEVTVIQKARSFHIMVPLLLNAPI